MSETLALIPPDALALIDRVKAHASAIGAIIEVAPLETVEADTKARELLRVIETLDGQADAERKKLKAPHLERGREIDDAFKVPREALARVGALIRRRLGEAAVRRERERTEALARAAEAARAGDHETANIAVLEADPVFAPVAAGVSERFTWEAKAFDVRAMPVEFLTVDMPRIRAEIAAANREGREPKIPGVTFERAAGLVVRKL